MQSWLRSIWTDIRGASLRDGHPAPYPVPLAERLIKLFSFAGDTGLDPFGGTGSTAIAAINTGRNSVLLDIEPSYVAIARDNVLLHAPQRHDLDLYVTFIRAARRPGVEITRRGTERKFFNDFSRARMRAHARRGHSVAVGFGRGILL